MPSKDSNYLTKMKEEQYPRSFQNPLNVHPASDHTIQQKTNSDHAMDVTVFITAEKNVKRNIGRGREMDTSRDAIKNQNKNIKNNKKNNFQNFGPTQISLEFFFGDFVDFKRV